MSKGRAQLRLDRLPAFVLQGWAALREDLRNASGRPRTLDELVRRNLTVITYLVEDGVSYRDLAMLLADIGVTRPDGAPANERALATALHRARRRANRASARVADSHVAHSAPSPVPAKTVAGPDPPGDRPLDRSPLGGGVGSSSNADSPAERNRKAGALLNRIGKDDDP